MLHFLVQLGVESVRYFDLHFFAQALAQHFGEHFGLVGSLVRLDQLMLIQVAEILWQADSSRLPVIEKLFSLRVCLRVLTAGQMKR